MQKQVAKIEQIYKTYFPSAVFSYFRLRITMMICINQIVILVGFLHVHHCLQYL